jgi:uncharacterized protein YndB with AHSA1/START domain
MRRPWFTTLPVDETFFDSAPVILRGIFDIGRPAERVWADLTADDTLSWCRILNKIEWTSPKPYGVGTTRTAVSLQGASVFHERYFRWEEGRRASFYVEETSAPLFKRFAEDYLVEPISETGCRFTWTVALQPSALGKPGMAINRRLLGTLFTDTRKHYDAG